MKEIQWFHHSVTLLKRALSRRMPADRLVTHYFREHPALGSQSRQHISDWVFQILRWKGRIVGEIEGRGMSGENSESLPLWLFYWLSSHNEVNAEFRQQIVTHYFEGRDPLLTSETFSGAFSLPIRTSFPSWILSPWVSRYGENFTESLAYSLNQAAPFVVRVNPQRKSREELLEILKTEGIDALPTQWSPWGIQFPKRTNLFLLPSFKKGYYEVQDEGSQIVCFLVDSNGRGGLLEPCAGAGGKSLALAQSAPQQKIYVWDIRREKIKELIKRSRRAGVRFNILSKEQLQSRRPLIDTLFLDVPCSGLGTLRRNPAQKWHLTSKFCDKVEQTQRELLERYLHLLRPGGEMIYVTCTLREEENENQMEIFLKNHPEFACISPRQRLRAWLGEKAESMIVEGGGYEYLTLFPHRHGCDGFFAALLKSQVHF